MEINKLLFNLATEQLNIEKTCNPYFAKFQKFITRICRIFVEELKNKDKTDLASGYLQVLVTVPLNVYQCGIEEKITEAAKTLLDLLPYSSTKNFELFCTVLSIWLNNILQVTGTRKVIEDTILLKRLFQFICSNKTHKLFVEFLTSADLNLSMNVGDLFYNLCNKDASLLIKNVGYGNIAGFLYNNKINFNVNNGLSTKTDTHDIDYVSGEKITSKVSIDLTDEEKEREAEKLFVLFERIRKNGVLKIKNPIEDAIQRGDY